MIYSLLLVTLFTQVFPHPAIYELPFPQCQLSVNGARFIPILHIVPVEVIEVGELVTYSPYGPPRYYSKHTHREIEYTTHFFIKYQIPEEHNKHEGFLIVGCVADGFYEWIDMMEPHERTEDGVYRGDLVEKF